MTIIQKDFMIKQGGVITYFDKGNLLLGIIMEDKGKKLLILSEDNNKTNISSDKIEMSLEKSIPLSGKDFEIARELKNIKSNIENISQTIHLKELYELLKDENQGFTYQSLCELYFNQNSSKSHQIAMILSLTQNNLYFKQKNNLYYPKPEKAVLEQLEEIDRLKQNELKKISERQNALKWLKDNYSPTPNDHLTTPHELTKLLEPIRQYIIHRDLYEKKSQAISLFEEIKQIINNNTDNSITNMFQLLRNLNIFQEDENLSLLRYSISRNYSEKTLNELSQVPEFSFDNQSIYRDLTQKFTFSIDDSDTKDVDDAISFEETDNGYILEIHIADASYFIIPDSALDNDALNRGMSVYLPLEKISMFPKDLSENKMSLLEGKNRPVLTFQIIFNKNYEMMNSDLFLSCININNNYNYKESHDWIEQSHPDHPYLKHLYEISLIFHENRKSKGAIEFRNQDFKIKVDEERHISLVPISENLKSSFIIKELMILTNHITANYCLKHNIPAIYICQEPPDEPLQLTTDIRNNKPLLIEQLKKLKKSEMFTIPKKHYALGLDTYTQITSPIRRYHDLIMHRQIKNYLDFGKPYYTSEDIQVIAATAERSSREIKTIERETTRYWLLKYLKQEKKRSFKANVIKVLTNSYLVEIQEVGVQTVLMTPSRLFLNDEIDISIDRVNPLMDIINIKRTPFSQE